MYGNLGIQYNISCNSGANIWLFIRAQSESLYAYIFGCSKQTCNSLPFNCLIFPDAFTFHVKVRSLIISVGEIRSTTEDFFRYIVENLSHGVSSSTLSTKPKQIPNVLFFIIAQLHTLFICVCVYLRLPPRMRQRYTFAPLTGWVQSV